MAACVASPSSWTSSLPYAPHQQPRHTPLRPTSATWNTKGLSLSLDLPVYTTSHVPAKPRLRLPILATTTSSEHLPSRRFDPFADEPVASTSTLPSQHTQSQNTPPPARGRALTPLCISSPLTPSAPSTPSTPVVGRRRAPSFSAGSGTTPRGTPLPLSTLSALSTSPSNSLACAPSPAPSLSRPSSPSSSLRVGVTPPPPVKGAPTPFHARHYPTPDARARLLARTLLNRIHAVGRPRSGLYSCSKMARSNGYESECGSRGYTPSRLSECVTVC